MNNNGQPKNRIQQIRDAKEGKGSSPQTILIEAGLLQLHWDKGSEHSRFIPTDEFRKLVNLRNYGIGHGITTEEHAMSDMVSLVQAVLAGKHSGIDNDCNIDELAFKLAHGANVAKHFADKLRHPVAFQTYASHEAGFAAFENNSKLLMEKVNYACNVALGLEKSRNVN